MFVFKGISLKNHVHLFFKLFINFVAQVMTKAALLNTLVHEFFVFFRISALKIYYITIYTNVGLWSYTCVYLKVIT
jgi:hypothetical protein